MAGQTEKDLRQDCAHTTDIILIKRDLHHFGEQLAAHGAQLTAIASKQDENYESIRKRLHQIAGDAEHRIAQVAVDADKDITAVGRKVDALEAHYVQASADMKLMAHTIDENAQKSEDRHNSVMGILSQLSTGLNGHMRDEQETLKSALHPISESLDKLHSRWWSLAVWGLMALGGGLIGTVIYIWQNMGVNP
jgi:chromosome segregation ATPase